MDNYSKIETFTPPGRSLATRDIPYRSKASFRYVVIAKTPALSEPRAFHLESRLEAKVFFLAIADRSIFDIWEQPPAVTFRNFEGKIKRHVFDLLLTFKSGHKRAVAIKPFARVKNSNLTNDLKHIGRSLPKGFADDIALVTDRDFSKSNALNAERLHLAQKVRDIEADDILREFSCGLLDPISISELAQKTGLFGRCYNAVLRAIFEGHLREVSGGIIGLENLVVSTGALS